MRLLPRDEQQRALRYRLPEQRHRFIAARTALRRLLGELLACAPERILFGYGAAGRPEILWPATDLTFNISHSRSSTLIGVARGTPIGVDLEWPDEQIDPLAVGRRVFSAEELRRLKSCNAREQKRVFFKLWTAKEAVLKMLGAGFSLEPRRVDLARAIDPTTPACIPLQHLGHAYRVRLTHLELAPPYMAAVAVLVPEAAP